MAPPRQRLAREVQYSTSSEWIVKSSPLPTLTESKAFSISRQELKEMLKSVSYAQSVNEEIHAKRGVLSINNEELSLVATDGQDSQFHKK